MITKILVMGSSGTIGTRLCEKLLAKGYKVTGIDWKHNKWSQDVDKTTIIGDIRDKKTFDRVPKDFDLVIHLAANAMVYDSVVNPDLAFDNFITVYNTLEFARKSDIKKFMFASSREVYGNTEKMVLKEDEASIINCESPYAASKFGGEVLTRAYNRCYGTEFIIFRFSNVYGMYDDSNRVMPLFIRQAKQGKDLTVFGKDKMLDFTYIDDNIKGIMLCIENFDRIKNDTINIAYGQGSTILSIAELIRKKLNPKINIILKEKRTGEVVKYTADISKMRKMGYRPEVDIIEGIGKSIEWYGKNISIKDTKK
jgi:nucleoside-diphosphate-sugar epimerase